MAETKVSSLQIETRATAPVSPVQGQFYFDTTVSLLKVYDGSIWKAVGSGAVGGGSNAVFVENDQSVTVDYIIGNGFAKNAMSAGPITIANGITVTVPNGSTWSIV